ncbi:MAG: CRISPR-associated protein Csx11 [Promethearchaeota archaeon]
MNDLLNKLAENRNPILLSEIGGYIHLIGRFSKDFIFSQSSDASTKEKEFNYINVCNSPNFFENTGLNQILIDQDWKNLINDFKKLNISNKLLIQKINNFNDFITKHRWSRDLKGLCQILADAHGIVVAIDKGLAAVKRIEELGKQKKKCTFKATAFGYETKIEIDKIQKLKRELFQEIKIILNNIKQNRSVCSQDYFNFKLTIKKYYQMTIGDTRRPINEISLYDYAHTIATLMKSNLAKIIIDGWFEPKGKSNWRILRINIDVIRLLSNSVKIGDIVGYKEELENIYKNIKEIIEYKYPLGNEIYRDSTGIYFICPNVRDIGSLKSNIIDELKNILNTDFSFHVEISDKSSRSMVILTTEREKALNIISYPHIGKIENLEKEFDKSKNSGGKDICPVCRIRLKLEKEDRCDKCKNRYKARVKNWVNQHPEKTIWLDEIADKNDRVALIIGEFNLGRWLSGNYMNTFFSRNFKKEWQEANKSLCSNLSINSLNDLRKLFEDLFNHNSLNKQQKKLLRSFINIRINNFINDFWKPIAERDPTREALNLRDNSEKAKYLIKLLFKKHPSLARIYRIWNTTYEFINKTIFEKILKGYNWNSEIRRQRIKLRIYPNPNIPNYSTYDININGVWISPVCIDSQNGIFESTINLEILKNFGETVKKISKEITNKKIYNKNGETFNIIQAEPTNDNFNNYLPYLKIYEYPDQFMMFVPAYEALDIAENILNEYEIQFSKVRDRLAFHLGIIAFQRKTPLYTIIDAGRRLLKEFKIKTKTKLVKVNSIEDIYDERLGKSKELEIKMDLCKSIPIKWKISYSTGDPEQEDWWYPYLRVKNPSSNNNENDDKKIVYIKEIKKNDIIEIEPSYFKLFYLGNAADRFKVNDDLKPVDYIHFLKILWKEIEKKLKLKIWTISQINTYWDEIKKRRQSYDEDTFKQFVKSALINILKINPQKDKDLFNLFFQTTMNEILDLCLYWNFQIRKIKLRR